MNLNKIISVLEKELKEIEKDSADADSMEIAFYHLGRTRGIILALELLMLVEA